jgi:hypothetical protein
VGPQGRSGRVRKISPTPPTGIRSTDQPALSESLYRLSYRGSNNNNFQTRTLSSVTDSPTHIRSPQYPPQPQSTLDKHQSAHLSLLPLPFTGRFMALLLHKMFLPTAEKSIFSYALTEVSYFYVLGKFRDIWRPGPNFAGHWD